MYFFTLLFSHLADAFIQKVPKIITKVPKIIS